MQCKWHSCNKELSGKQTKFCSKKCKAKFHVDNRRKALKQKAVDYKGGKCANCGFDKSISALQFHHVNEKDFGISQSGFTRSWESIQKEIDKCILLCANCHSILHYDPSLIDLSLHSDLN